MEKSLRRKGVFHYDPCTMKIRCCFTRVCLMFIGSSGLALATDEAPDAVAVPEPSALVLAGLCGLLFLLWRNK